MRYLLFVGHGQFGEGLRSAVEMLMGERDWILSCSMAEDGDYEGLLDETLKGLSASDECVVLADIAGGSPERIARAHLAGIGIAEGQVLGFGGANLAMALSAVMGIEEGLGLDVIADALLAEGTGAVRRL